MPGQGLTSLVGDLLGSVTMGGRTISNAMHLDRFGSAVAGMGSMALRAATTALASDGSAAGEERLDQRSAGVILIEKIYEQGLGPESNPFDVCLAADVVERPDQDAVRRCLAPFREVTQLLQIAQRRVGSTALDPRRADRWDAFACSSACKML